MSDATHPETLPAEVLDDVARVIGAEVMHVSRLPGGFDVGAMRVQLAGRADAVMKAWPRAGHSQLDEVVRAQRVIESTCVGAAIPPRPASAWEPQPRVFGV